MKIILSTLFIFFIGCNTTQNITPKQKVIDISPDVYGKTITEADLKKHLYIYASNAFEGRETGTEGQKKAVNYIRDYYKTIQVPAAQGDGKYFQNVPLHVKYVPSGSFVIGNSSYNSGSDFIPIGDKNISFEEVVYIGYGIEDQLYSDFTNINIKNKVVLVKEGEPKNDLGIYLLTNSEKPSSYTTDSMGKITTLLDKGAKAVLLYAPSIMPRVVASYTRTRDNPSERMELLQENTTSFTAIIGSGLANKLNPEIDINHVPQVLKVKGASAIISNSKKIATENVAAIIRGTKYPEEYIILSSHLDHIGLEDNGVINNGADDDGSGTVALLEIAQAFKIAKDAGHGPKRSIVFLHVTGEEKGLLGSKYYTDIAPIFPLNQTIANLNIDMIGRIDPKRKGNDNYLYLIGSDRLSTELHQISETANRNSTNISLDYTYNNISDPNRYYYRSDHYNFAKNNIPVIFYFNGTHEDYHKPGDTPDKINYNLLENRTKLVYYTAWEIANRKERLKLDKNLN